MKALLPIGLTACALASAGVAAGDVIGPPANTKSGSWVAGCIHADHPAGYGTGAPADACGWVAAPRAFAFCHDYPGGIGVQLTCYSPRSGWVVNIPAAEPPGRRPWARKVDAALGRVTRALEIRAGSTWYDSMPERTAEVVCAATRRFFRCDLGSYGVWFKPDGSFVLYRRLFDPKTFLPRGTVLVYGSR